MSADTKGHSAKPETAESVTSVALARVAEPGLVSARGPAGLAGNLETALLAFLQSKTSLQAGAPGSLVPVERRIFLTIAESADFSGLPVVFLRRLIASGKLRALKTGAGWRVPRAEIEKLAATLTDAREDLTEHEIRDMEMNRRRRQES